MPSPAGEREGEGTHENSSKAGGPDTSLPPTIDRPEEKAQIEDFLREQHRSDIVDGAAKEA